MNKKATFFIDDVIWVFRDLTRKRPDSMWDNPYMATLKRAHDEYGVKTQLNVFYKTCFWYDDDDFSLSDMTDAYKKEFEEASDWLKLGFHSKEEWPDYPFINADYGLVDELSKYTHQEYLSIGNHEQYYYPDYYAYQPDYAEKILTMGKVMKEAGFEFMFMEDLPR